MFVIIGSYEDFIELPNQEKIRPAVQGDDNNISSMLLQALNFGRSPHTCMKNFTGNCRTQYLSLFTSLGGVFINIIPATLVTGVTANEKNKSTTCFILSTCLLFPGFQCVAPIIMCKHHVAAQLAARHAAISGHGEGAESHNILLASLCSPGTPTLLQ